MLRKSFCRENVVKTSSERLLQKLLHVEGDVGRWNVREVA
jgi:hypothetical protein